MFANVFLQLRGVVNGTRHGSIAAFMICVLRIPGFWMLSVIAAEDASSRRAAKGLGCTFACTPSHACQKTTSVLQQIGSNDACNLPRMYQWPIALYKLWVVWSLPLDLNIWLKDPSLHVISHGWAAWHLMPSWSQVAVQLSLPFQNPGHLRRRRQVSPPWQVRCRFSPFEPANDPSGSSQRWAERFVCQLHFLCRGNETCLTWTKDSAM